MLYLACTRISFLSWLIKILILLYVYSSFYLSVHPSMDSWVEEAFKDGRYLSLFIN